MNMNMDFASCSRSMYLRIPEVQVESIPDDDGDDSSTDITTVNFNFKYKARFYDWYLPQDSPQQRFIGRTDGSAFVASITLTLEQVLSAGAEYLLYERLHDWPAYDWCGRFLIGYGIGRVRNELVGDMPECGFNRRVSIRLHVRSLHRHVYIPSFYMVPTAEQAIESLQIREITTAEDAADADTCVICIDEFNDEQEVREMPCSHFFHGECINRWLRTSHYCPCCRFQMAVQ